MTRQVRRGAFKRSCRTCSWTGTYDTAGKGDYAKRRHSCAKQQRVDARHERGQVLRAGVDRTPKPCLHKIADHQHGTYACYTLDLCRCAPCCVAVSEYERYRKRRHAYGRWDNFVDAEPARQHLLWLMSHGMGLKRVIATGAIAQGSAWKLLYGKNGRPLSRRLRKDVAERVLAVPLDLADGARVSGADTARRLQALVANGWSMAKLGRFVGVEPGNFNPTVHGLRHVEVRTAKAVHALYVELADQVPPQESHRDKIAVSRARNLAAANGWLPPLRINGKLHVGTALPTPMDTGLTMAEHADLEDDVDEVSVERRMSGDRSVPLTRAERLALVRRLHAQGLTDTAIHERTGIASDTALRDRKLLGLAANAAPTKHPIPTNYFAPRPRSAQQRVAS